MSERLVPVPRRARPWQPNPALLLVSTARAFAAAHWDEVRDGARHAPEALDEPEGQDPQHDTAARAFANDGLNWERDDFRPLQIRPFNQPLSELSRQALQRFNAELAAENPIVAAGNANDALMQEAASDAVVRAYRADPLLTRAAFTPDVYEFDDDVAQDDLNQHAADNGEQADESADEQEAVLEALSQDAEPDLEADASDDIKEVIDTATEVEIEATAEEAIEATAEEASTEVGAETAELGESQETPSDEIEAMAADSNGDSDAAKQAQAVDDVPVEETPEAPIEPMLEASGDVSEPDMSEADLAQDDVIAPQAMDETKAEVEEAAVEAALQEAALQEAAQTPATPGVDFEELARREAEQYQLGYAEGERVAREAMAQEIAAQRTVLEGVTQQLHALLQDPQQFFEPLKRLAVHVAEQVVVGELKTSPRIIEQLIQRCLDTLDHPAQGMVVVELNPQDKARLLETAPELIKGMRIDALDDLHPGSVRLFANDTVVEDLVEHRMQSLVRGLQLKEAAWKTHSALLKDTPEPTADSVSFSQHSQPADQSESDDVHP